MSIIVEVEKWPKKPIFFFLKAHIKKKGIK